MDFSTQIVPAVVVLLANLLSGKHTSVRWETVTAIFGWGTGLSIAGLLLLSVIAPNNPITSYLAQLAAFCLLTALSRDCEKLLRPFFPGTAIRAPFGTKDLGDEGGRAG